MTFKDIKAGFPIYILHRGESISVSQGKAVSVSQPRVPSLTNPFQTPSALTQQLVVDVTIDEGGVQKTYTIPETLDTTYAGNDLVIATNREGIVRELEAMKAKAEEVLASVEAQERTRATCEKILAEFNPIYKERRANDERFGKLENQIGEISSLVKSLVSKLS